MAERDAEAFRALTLLFAFCEQVDLDIKRLDPPIDGDLAADLAVLKVSLYDTLQSPRFNHPA